MKQTLYITSFLFMVFFLSACAHKPMGLTSIDHGNPKGGAWTFISKNFINGQESPRAREMAIDGIENFCNGEANIYREELKSSVATTLYFHCQSESDAKN